MTFRTIAVVAAVGFTGIVLYGWLVPVTSSGPGLSAKLALCRHELALLTKAAEQYRTNYGSYPRGEHREFIRSLLGDNPDKIAFVGLNRRRFNPAGEFLDPWGTPYVLQIIAGTNVFIHSAGENGIFGDKDDVTMSAAHR